MRGLDFWETVLELFMSGIFSGALLGSTWEGWNALFN
jgi:hypothetical protein